jgi:hypothetical protein
MNKKEWGLSIAALVGLAAGASVFYNSMRSDSRNDSVREQSVFDTKKKENLEDKVQGIMAHDGVRVDIYKSDVVGKHSGFKLEIDKYQRDKWMSYVPLTCEVPGINYSAPLPIENDMKSAKLTLKNPENLFGETLYIVGTDQSGRAVKLYEFTLGGSRGK